MRGGRSQAGGIRKRFSLSSFQLIILGFAALILVGALLLMLPISSRDRTVTPFGEALFTATSAGCVTGLVIHDTATHWSYFGQAVILVLIQIGGLGVVTVAASLSMIAGKKLSLKQQSTMQESISAPRLGGVTKFTGFVVKTTFIIETVGAALLMPVMIPRFGASGIWRSFFHSISAFCNAGFDLMGTPDGKYQSLTSFSGAAYINVVIILLIVIGGIGFLTWEDVSKHKFRIKRYRMQSKVVLVTSAILIILPALFLFFTEYASSAPGERITRHKGLLFHRIVFAPVWPEHFHGQDHISTTFRVKPIIANYGG